MLCHRYHIKFLQFSVPQSDWGNSYDIEFITEPVPRDSEKNSIDTALLISISVILHRNFFRELSDEVENRLVE